MCEDRLAQRRELSVVEERRLIRRAPELPSDEPLVPGEESRRSRRLIHIESFPVRIVWPVADVVNFQIRECRHVYDATPRTQARRRQVVSGEIHAIGRRLTNLQVSHRVVRVGLAVEPPLSVERQARDVTRSALDLLESLFTEQYGRFDFWIIWN